MFRVWLNLTPQRGPGARNLRPQRPRRDQIRITGRREGAVVAIETGPGLTGKTRAHLFEAFQGSTRAGGTVRHGAARCGAVRGEPRPLPQPGSTRGTTSDPRYGSQSTVEARKT
jgi:hypothetical protein